MKTDSSIAREIMAEMIVKDLASLPQKARFYPDGLTPGLKMFVVTYLSDKVTIKRGLVYPSEYLVLKGE